ncbi:MAG: energy-coupling factor transporter transmembrane protein EcfT, partial [Firmicutes bacterium]|nr:energy-coupling factor transporter transmembrane protein EcfT [Bacillota bacterium]
SALTSWAFEGGIITADSMRSRGYGTGKRTNFSIYKFETRDRLLLIIMLLLLAAVFLCGLKGGTTAAYTPDISLASNQWTVFGAIAYFIFLAIPTALNLLEALTWHILRSKI